MKEPRRTGIVLKPDKEFVYLPTNTDICKFPNIQSHYLPKMDTFNSCTEV